MARKDDIVHISDIFKERLEAELNGTETGGKLSSVQTRNYNQFKKQYLPKHLSIYEKLCQFAEKTIPFKPDDDKVPALQEAIDICHLNTTPTGVYSASMLVPIALVLTSMIVFFMIPMLLGGTGNLFFVVFALLAGLALLVPLQSLPFTLADFWRIKASNQMVLSVFYVVTYMRHTSNLELAINFAAEHLAPPLSLDLRKVVWDLETQKYDSIKDSLSAYLETWRKWNIEFVESMHLIQSSLYETSNDRRLNTLDKSLEVMLTETYNKMLHYAHNLKGPLTTLNMLGVVLPILTLVILPLVVSFMGGFRWYHLLALYNIALPILVLYMGQKILSTRPGGSGQEDITAKNPELKKYGNVIVAGVNYNSDFALLGFIHYAINRKLNFYEKQKNILYGGELSKSGTSRVADSDEISKCIKKVENLNAEFMSVIDVSTKPKNKITFFYIGDKKLENELLGLEYKYNIRLDSVKGTIELLKDQENAKKYLEGVILKGFEKFFTAFYYNK